MSQHFLYVTNDKIVSLLLGRGSSTVRSEFRVADIESPKLTEHLSRHSSVPTTVITDLIEEDFRTDTVPHLRGGDQDAVLERKLSQLYRISPYRHALVQGREAEGRRDDRVFFHAVTNADFLKPLISQLEKLQVPLLAVSSSAVLSSRLLKELDTPSKHSLLVTIVPDFGLRQTYFNDGQIKFSRLTPIIYDEAKSVGDLIAAETSRTWQYLDSLHTFGEQDSLEVCMLVHARDRGMMSDAIRRFPMLRYRFVEIGELAKKLRMASEPTSSHAEQLLCHLYAQSRVENHFGSREETRFATYRRIRLALISLTAAIVVIGAGGTGFNMYQATRISNEIEARTRQERQLQNDYQAVVNSMRLQKMGTDTVRDTSAFFNSQIRPHPASPTPLALDLGRVLNDFPDVQVVQLAWMVSNNPDATPSLPPASGASSPQAISSERRATPSASAPPTPAATPVDPANPPLPGNRYQSVVLDAMIRPFDGNTRKALLQIDALVAKLSALPNTKVRLIRVPVDVGLGVTLKVQELPPTINQQAGFAIVLTKEVGGV